MTKKTVYWLCQVLGWGAWGLLQVLAYTTSNGFDVQQAIGELFQIAFYIITSHFLRYLFLKYHWINLRLKSLIPRLFFSILILSLANYGYLLILEYFTTGITNADFMPLTFFINIAIFWTLYFLWTTFYFIFHYVDRYDKSIKAETAAREVELNNLKAQLNPHFIFNALNSIRALVDEDPKKSKESITQLSGILRNSLNSDRKKLVPFAEELKTVKEYLDLESIRYEERLSTRFDIERDSGRFNVPPLMLQTLVENGIKHGIATLKEGGEISIVSRVKRKHLYLEIRNNGQLPKNFDESKGFGIKNTTKRLKLIFGDRSKFEIKNENEENVVCTLKIPTYDGMDFGL